MGYLCANFSLLCSRLRPDVRDRQIDRQTDRQTDKRQTKGSLLPPPYGDGGIINIICQCARSAREISKNCKILFRCRVVLSSRSSTVADTCCDVTGIGAGAIELAGARAPLKKICQWGHGVHNTNLQGTLKISITPT